MIHCSYEDDADRLPRCRLAEKAKGRCITLQIGDPAKSEGGSRARQEDFIDAEEWYKTIKARPECVCRKCSRMDAYELQIDWRAWREEAYIVDYCDGPEDEEDC